MGLIIFQLVTLIPVLAAWVLVLRYRSKLPFPVMMTGVSVALAFAVVRRIAVILAVVYRSEAWMWVSAFASLAMPTIMFFVGLSLLRSYAAKGEELEAMEKRIERLLSRSEPE